MGTNLNLLASANQITQFACELGLVPANLIQSAIIQVFAMNEKFGEALKVKPISWQFWAISMGCCLLEFPYHLFLHYCWPKFLLVEPVEYQEAAPVGISSAKVSPEGP